MWTLDVEGHRVLIVAHYFPGTPQGTVAQLTQMVKSLRFPSRLRDPAAVHARDLTVQQP